MTEADAYYMEPLLSRLREDGFDVNMHPSPSLVPRSFEGYVPDIIATREGKKLAIEFKREGEAPPERRRGSLGDLSKKHPDWEFQMYWLRSSPDLVTVSKLSKEEIEAGLKRVRDLIDRGLHQPALLMAWAMLEAVGRALSPTELQRPHSARGLVGKLEADGILLPPEADELRVLADRRNELVHGGLTVEPSKTDLLDFVGILDTLFRELSKPESSAA